MSREKTGQVLLTTNQKYFVLSPNLKFTILAVAFTAVNVFFLNLHVCGQNLVSNPGFECGSDPCNPSDGVSSIHDMTCGWWEVNHATPDEYSTKISPLCGNLMPVDKSKHPNYLGSQLPRTGNRFAGIINFYRDTVYRTLWREYLGAVLTDPLVIGQEYCAEAYVSLAENSLYAAGDLGFYFANAYPIGVYFGEPLANYDKRPVAYYQPQVMTAEIITDTVNWVRVGGVFTAQDQYQYMIFGNFKSDTTTAHITFTRGSTYNFAYYYVDDFFVGVLPDKTITYDGDFTVCKGDQTNIEAKIRNADVTWYKLNDRGTPVSVGNKLLHAPTETTSYYVRADGHCNTLREDTITVVVNPKPIINLGKDTIVCTVKDLLLDGGNGTQFLWQDKSTNRFFDATASGKYFVKATNDLNCVSYDTINVTFKKIPAPHLGPDTLLCDQYIHLRTGLNKDHYKWSTGATDSVIILTPFNIPKTDDIWVLATNECGSGTDTVRVYRLENVFLPNVVTPNDDDQLNRYFTWTGVPENTSGFLQVFDRWGTKVYSKENYKGEWPVDSSIDDGVYYFTLSFNGCGNYKGWISVVK